MDIWDMLGITRQMGLGIMIGGIVVAGILGLVFRARAARAETHRGFDLGNRG